ncbi:MAG: DnaD domain protein, partial [Oscillospiraceae bacterium]|nr:DnaD domain protein [Oscillospiraceae bacterium]
DASQPVPDAIKYNYGNSSMPNSLPDNNIKQESAPELKQQSVKEIKNRKEIKQSIKPSRNTSEEIARLSNQDISEIIANSTELKNLIQKSQKYFSGNQYAMQVRSLIWMHEYLGMNPEVILILLDYCNEVHKLNLRYIDKIAFQWWEDEIFTEEDAKNQVKYLTDFYTYRMYIKRLFEMGSNPTKAQNEFIERWQAVGYS